MRRLLVLALAAGGAYGASLLLLRARPAPQAARPQPSAPDLQEPAALDPFADGAPPAARYEEEPPPPEEQPWGPPAASRPNVRSLKVAGVPAPGAERTPEETRRARALDAAARAPAGSSLGSLSGLGGGGGASVSYRAPDLRRPARPEERAPSAGRSLDAGRGARPAAAARGAAAGPPKAEPRRAPAPAGVPDAPAQAAAASPLGAGAPGPAPEAVGWSPAAGLVNAAKGLSFSKRPDAAVLKLANDPVGKELLRMQAVDSGARAALAKLSEGGREPTEQEQLAAVSAAYQAAGVTDATDAEVRERLAIAQLPALPPPAPLEMMQFLERTGLDQPPSPEDVRLAQEANAARRTHPDAETDAPPRPSGPPPRNAAEAYRAVRDALEKGHRDFGVLPKHAFGIFGVESSFGRNTGRYNIMRVLRGEQADPRRGRAGRRQTANDIAAMAELERRGMLGGHRAESMLGSHGAAFGHTQFRPSSWLAYGRDPDGGPGRDPYDMRTAVYSTANYLRGHGYSRNVDRAIYGYNHDWGYVRSVQNMATRVESTIIAPSRASR